MIAPLITLITTISDPCLSLWEHHSLLKLHAAPLGHLLGSAAYSPTAPVPKPMNTYAAWARPPTRPQQTSHNTGARVSAFPLTYTPPLKTYGCPASPDPSGLSGCPEEQLSKSRARRRPGSGSPQTGFPALLTQSPCSRFARSAAAQGFGDSTKTPIPETICASLRSSSLRSLRPLPLASPSWNTISSA